MYPADLEADVVLSDGGTVRVRPIRPDDGERILALHARLSPQSIYYRFFAPRPRLSDEDVRRFTHVDYVDRLALVALLGDGIVAVARYDRYAGTDDAEVAFLVDDAHHGRGLGTVLLEHLAAAARHRGIGTFSASVLPENRRMIGVFRAAGFEVATRFAEGVVEVALDIEATETAAAAIARREHVAEAASVQRLLAPRSVAVIGASRAPGTVSHELLRHLLDGGFAGPVHAVNPAADSVLGLPAVPSVTAVAGPVDLAVVVVPAAAVPGVVGDCAAKGVGGLVVVSGGFSDAGPGGRAAERALVAQARGHGMRLVGPNAMGVVNTDPAVRLHATFAPVHPLPGPVGVASQSGALGAAVLAEARRLGVGVSTFVAFGDKADVSSNDLLQFWEEDPRTEVILLYLESFGNPRKFGRLARRVSHRKPVVAVRAGRAGRSQDGLELTEEAVAALFRQAGVIRVDTLASLFDVARVLVGASLPPGRRVGIVANAAGPGALAADACVAAGLELADLSPLGWANPVELPHTTSVPGYRDEVRRVLQHDAVDAVLALFTPPLVAQVDEAAAAIAEAAASVPAKPLLANLLALGPLPGRAPLPALPVPAFAFPEEAASALGKVAAYAEWRRRPSGTVPEPAGLDVGAAREAAAALLRDADTVRLDAATASRLLGLAGVAVAPAEAAPTADEAAAAAARLGYPVALKLGGDEPVARSLAGGVALDLYDEDALRRAHARMGEALGERMGGAVVQAMVPPGTDVSVRVAQHRAFGPLVGVGLGGRASPLVEHVWRAAPLTDVDAAELVAEVRGGPPALAQGPFQDLLLRLGVLAAHAPEIVEAVLEPVIVSPERAVAVDVRLSLARWEGVPEPAARQLRPPPDEG